MKTTDLMVGDWVLFIGNPKKVTSLLVTDLGVDQIYVFGKSCQVATISEYIEPIPLTAEILEKNGFVYISKGMFYSYYSYAADGYIKVRLSDLQDGEWELSIDNYDKFNDSSTKYTVDRCFLKVHELQHALKLCGIDKEIQL